MPKKQDNWKIVSWYCPNCGHLIGGIPNAEGKIKTSCGKCKTEMVLKNKGRRHDTLELFRELKKDKNAQQFMFVDEFQDTDDSQIESLLRIAQVLDYNLFLVGDIKQCIYRFRGAKEKAFDQLGIEKNPKKWLEFSLQRNYRTDKHLLDIFDRSFTAWGEMDEELLTYDAAKDKLIGTRDYNGRYLSSRSRFYRRLPAENEEMRIPVLVEEIKRIQKRIQYEESHGMKLSAKEKSIAILVRENWQADMIRTECARLGISVHTNTGGDLYMSQPAMDMLTLVNALVHFDEADYLYNLVTSNFFNLDIPKSNLYEIRMRIRTGGWRAKADEKEQVNYLINFMNVMCRIVRPPADGHGVVQRCADRAVDGQQGFVAGAVLQAFGLEVCNQLLISDFRDFCVVCRKIRRDIRFYIVGEVGILLCGNICNLVIEPFPEKIREKHPFVDGEIVRVKLGTGFHEHFLCPLLVSLNGESGTDGLAPPLSRGIFPCQNHLEIAVLLS